MKTGHWPIFVLTSYFIVNVLLVLGIFKLSFWQADADVVADLLAFAVIVAIVLMLCQVFLFDIKVLELQNRPVPKRKITTAAIFISSLMAILTLSAFVLLTVAVFGEGSPVFDHETFFFAIVILLFLGSWVFWAYNFLACYNEKLPGQFLRKMTTRVMTGSIIELIIAIQCHIIYRNRDDCCAPLLSYFGMMAGTTILLLAFGPGILFLYLKRMNDKKPKTERK